MLNLFTSISGKFYTKMNAVKIFFNFFGFHLNFRKNYLLIVTLPLRNCLSIENFFKSRLPKVIPKNQKNASPLTPEGSADPGPPPAYIGSIQKIKIEIEWWTIFGDSFSSRWILYYRYRLWTTYSQKMQLGMFCNLNLHFCKEKWGYWILHKYGNHNMQRVRLWSGRFEVQISGNSNATQCCQWLATTAIFLRMELCYPGAITRRWTQQTRYATRHDITNIIDD